MVIAMVESTLKPSNHRFFEKAAFGALVCGGPLWPVKPQSAATFMAMTLLWMQQKAHKHGPLMEVFMSLIWLVTKRRKVFKGVLY